MKFRVEFKTPDALYYATEFMSEEEQDEAYKFADMYMQFGECITVEFDTVDGTVKVMEQ